MKSFELKLKTYKCCRVVNTTPTWSLGRGSRRWVCQRVSRLSWSERWLRHKINWLERRDVSQTTITTFEFYPRGDPISKSALTSSHRVAVSVAGFGVKETHRPLGAASSARLIGAAKLLTLANGMDGRVSSCCDGTCNCADHTIWPRLQSQRDLALNKLHLQRAMDTKGRFSVSA